MTASDPAGTSDPSGLLAGAPDAAGFTAAAPRAYLFLHGWQNHRPDGHWQRWAGDRLALLGHHVSYPQLPDADDPDLDVWLTELARHLAELPREGHGEHVVVAHSLSAVLWLHAVARGVPGLGVDRVLLVSPPAGQVLARYPEVAGFVPPPLDLVLPCPTRLAAGDDDPYCPGNAQTVYGDPLGVPTDLVPGGAHLDLDAGYGAWPALVDWCLDPRARITARPESPPE
ncbi:RBBP9/YdeN family alpha/beta hydrolase [Streptomyces sp. NPDC090306]|uniref:RBBP9/YdeN family alpha/beta hydrolase n=1 Tax=Streptomyces sp. NPDC090306 TaxID=3365961 RepID=UPI00382635C1